MARVAVEFALSAIEDLESILQWFDEQQAKDVGHRQVAEIMAHVEGLAEHPDIGRVVPEFNQDWLRELIHPPFRVVYKREKKKVRVVRVWRSERLLALSDE